MTDNSSFSAQLLRLLLRDLRTQSASYCRTAVAGAWGLALPFEAGIRFHFVAQGECWLRCEGMAPLLLRKGDVGLLPHGHSHVIASAPEGPTLSLQAMGVKAESEGQFRIDGPSNGALIQCCTVEFAEPLALQLVFAMPRQLVLRASDNKAPVAAILAIMSAELISDRAGSGGIGARLADAAIAMILREWTEMTDIQPQWLRADAHPGVLRSLLAIHDAPDRIWALSDLARLAGLSRSRFAYYFSALTGQSPGRYVARTKMRLATIMLEDKAIALAAVAHRLGYSDASAFSRAYSRATGRTPRAGRRPTEH